VRAVLMKMMMKNRSSFESIDLVFLLCVRVVSFLLRKRRVSVAFLRSFAVGMYADIFSAFYIGILILVGEKEEQTGKVVLQKTRKHPYLKEEQYATCSFFSARKHGLVDAGVRNGKDDVKTAFFCLPGGIGTLDEFFEILALYQLRRIGSEERVPFMIMNYDGVFDKLLEFITESCVENGLVNKGEMEEHLKVCSTNNEALEYLKQFYAL